MVENQQCQVCVEESTAADDGLCELVEREHGEDYKTKKHLPYKAAWVVPLIASTIAKTPMVFNQVLQVMLKPYRYKYCFMLAISPDFPNHESLFLEMH